MTKVTTQSASVKGMAVDFRKKIPMLGIENRSPFFQPFRQKGIQALWQFYYPLLPILAKTITRFKVTSTVLNKPLAIAVE
jgi:hypothetical protein